MRRVKAQLAIVAVALLAAASPASGAALFEDSAPLEVRIVGALDDLMSNSRRGGTDEFPFTLEVDGRSIDVKVRARGKSRREACTFPPLRLNIAKKSADGTPLAGQDKLKLVTHCKDSERFEQFVLEEYAIYRMLNAITPDSFRVRLLRVSYQQTGKGAGETHNAFVIETDDALAARIGGEVVKVAQIGRADLDQDYATTTALFQFLIANFDWSSVVGPKGDDCCHNGQPIRVNSLIRVVPYDFDLAGIISPPYAKPNPDLGARRVRERVYRGFCEDRPVLDRALERFRAARDDVLAVHAAVPGLSADELADQTNFVKSFYTLIDDPKALEAQIVRKCRSKPI